MNALHVVFELKGFLVRKEYYSPKMHGLMLSKRIVLKQSLEEFFRKCIEQFTVYF